MAPPPQVVEIHLKSVEQLFNSLDPSPFHERDLDDKAERYITDWVGELERGAPILLRFHLPASASGTSAAAMIPEAVRNYFRYRAEQTDFELRNLFRIGRQSLAIGLTVLAACLVASRYAAHWLGDRPFVSVAAESLLILGWVANWRPLEIFLYEWWPIRRRRELLKRIAAAPAEVEFDGARAG